MVPPSDYYDDHASEFIADTLSVDMEEVYKPFLSRVPPGGRILDAGCGSGRDTLAFHNKGYDVVSIDASAKMVELAKLLTGRPVFRMRFQEIQWVEEFDGIWACASLLHVPKIEMDEVWRRLINALKPGGAWFMSFKKGQGESIRKGRFFNDYEEQELRALIEKQQDIELLQLWTTRDVRRGREQEQWTNAIVRRVRSRKWF
jgi:2-polyprenyl-3-methyl-5-hydroxy-6-metoxy-1,4-benzoquinol methylase